MVDEFPIPVEYGNREGQYFREPLLETLKELVLAVKMGPCSHSEVVEVSDVKLWYDSYSDFHMLQFTARGRVVEVRLYRVFGSWIHDVGKPRESGKEFWVGCLGHRVEAYANGLRRELGVQIRRS